MLRFLLRRGFRRGVLEGNRTWLVVGAAALALRLVRKLGGSDPETVYSEKLAPGETLVISHEREAKADAHGSSRHATMKG